MTPLDNGNRWAVLGFTVFVLGVTGLIARAVPAMALVNESPSLPKGVYLRAPGAGIGPGAVVAAPQPPVASAYLSGLGMPPQTLLIKRVAALPGEAVCRTGQVVVTPRRTVRALRRDRRGAPLPAWAGCRRLAADELFLLGDTADSFDSRYFGPVHRGSVVGVYQEVLRW